MVTWHLTMKLFPAKCHERATLQKLWRQTGNSSLLPGQQFTVDCCCKWWLESQRGFQILLLSFVLLYNKSLNDWSLGEQWILFPSNLNISLDFVSGNIEILGKQNSLFPSGPVIKCLLLYGSVSQGRGTTKFTNLIGWNGYWPRSSFSHLDRHLNR